MGSRTHSVKGRLQKRFDRFLLFLFLKINLLQRQWWFWKHPDTIFSVYNDPNISWKEYIKVFLSDHRKGLKAKAWSKQEEKIKVERWERVVIQTWSKGSGRLCPVCRKGAITVNTVRYRDPAGKLSRVV